MKNKYLKRAHILERKFKELFKYFCSDFNATQTTQLSSVSRKTVNRLFGLFRKRIFTLTTQSEKMNGTVEIDESYFGPRRIRGKRGRGAGDKTPVLGILKREGQVHVSIVKDCSRKELLPIIKGQVLSESEVFTDGWNAYDGLITYGYKHHRIHHSKDEFVRGKNHVNGIESFWSYTKRRMIKFNGIHKNKFLLHLKECEYRWNHRDTMYVKLLKSFRKIPI